MKKVLLGLAIAGLFAACNGSTAKVTIGSTGDSTVAKNIKTALASEEAINSHDAEGVYKDVAPDFVDYGNGEYPPVKSLDSIKTNMKTFFDAFPDVKGTDLKTYTDSNTVVVTGIWTGTFKKDFMGMKATNKSFKVPDADILTFNDKGQMTSHRSIQLEATYFVQLGIPAPAKK